MEVFRAVADFRPPTTEGKHNLLSFSKGEQFEVFDNKKADWWGARRLNDDSIGYVPSKYLQYEERRIGKLLPNNYHEHRESQLKKFAAMQNSDQHKHPDYGEFGVPIQYLPLPADLDYFPSSADLEYLPPPAGLEYLPPPTGLEYLPPPAGTGPVHIFQASTSGQPAPTTRLSPTDDFEPVLDIPTPDYDPDTPEARRSSYVFVEKFRHVISNINCIEDLYTEVPEPDPDYQDEDSADFPPPPPPISTDSNTATTPTSPSSTAAPTIIGVRNGAVSSPEEEGELIQPKKLVNPCLASRERQALHKELLLNYKLGKDVLQKPELNKILAKRKETQKRKEWDEMQANKRTSLELKLEERANKIKEKEEDQMKTIEEDDNTPEFMQMHRRITHKTPTSPPT